MKPSVAIRVATSADENAIGAVLAASYAELLAGAYEPAVLEAALPLMTEANPTLLASGTYYVAALPDGRIGGCGGWTMERPGGGPVREGEGHVRHFGTDPALTRRGIAGALLRHCIGEARARGVRTLFCFSTLAAEAFYRAKGFETVEPIAVTLRPGVDLPSILMKRTIG